jgi:hypothetical protein
MDEIKAFEANNMRRAYEASWLRKLRLALYRNAAAAQFRNFSGLTPIYFRTLVAHGSLELMP